MQFICFQWENILIMLTVSNSGISAHTDLIFPKQQLGNPRYFLIEQFIHHSKKKKEKRNVGILVSLMLVFFLTVT
jgi:hypothetical protein